MSSTHKNYKFEFINTETRKPLFGILPSVEQTSQMDSKRIKECLDGITEAVEDEVQKHGFEEYSVSYNNRNDRERRMEVELPEASIEVTADIGKATKRGLRNFTFDPGFVSPGTTPRIAKNLKEKVDDARITARYRFNSDTNYYDTLYSDIADRLKGLTEELGLLEGRRFGEK